MEYVPGCEMMVGVTQPRVSLLHADSGGGFQPEASAPHSVPMSPWLEMPLPMSPSPLLSSPS